MSPGVRSRQWRRPRKVIAWSERSPLSIRCLSEDAFRIGRNRHRRIPSVVLAKSLRAKVKSSGTAMPKAKQVLTEQVSDLLLNAPEVSVFMTCCGLVNELRGLQRAFESGEINESILLEKSKGALAALRTGVAATERFDIVAPVASDGQFSPFFWRWFGWWEDYFKGLTVAQ